ncbi:DUF7472 family protein [Natronomonas sp. EA1]|uniref:DUF7472 family protein n=1 Tax=Natronomonas sp. EA1 TaxID=3421655 RepID=UPI003EBA3EEA
MELSRDAVVEIIASFVAVTAFVALILVIGTTYGGENLTQQGALALVGSIAVFVVLMAIVGVALERR